MKISIRKICVLAAIIFSLVTVSSTWAAKECNIVVVGSIDDLTPPMNSISVDGTVVYGIPRVYLENQGIVLEVGDLVEITAIQCNITGLLEACTLTVDGVEVDLPGYRNPGEN